MGANTNEHAIGLMYTTMAFDSRGYVLTRDQREARMQGSGASRAVGSQPQRDRKTVESARSGSGDRMDRTGGELRGRAGTGVGIGYSGASDNVPAARPGGHVDPDR